MLERSYVYIVESKKEKIMKICNALLSGDVLSGDHIYNIMYYDLFLNKNLEGYSIEEKLSQIVIHWSDYINVFEDLECARGLYAKVVLDEEYKNYRSRVKSFSLPQLSEEEYFCVLYAHIVLCITDGSSCRVCSSSGTKIVKYERSKGQILVYFSNVLKLEGSKSESFCRFILILCKIFSLNNVINIRSDKNTIYYSMYFTIDLAYLSFKKLYGFSHNIVPYKFKKNFYVGHYANQYKAKKVRKNRNISPVIKNDPIYEYNETVYFINKEMFYSLKKYILDINGVSEKSVWNEIVSLEGKIDDYKNKKMDIKDSRSIIGKWREDEPDALDVSNELFVETYKEEEAINLSIDVLISKKNRLIWLLQTEFLCENYEKIYFIWSYDFRGRIYCQNRISPTTNVYLRHFISFKKKIGKLSINSDIVSRYGKKIESFFKFKIEENDIMVVSSLLEEYGILFKNELVKSEDSLKGVTVYDFIEKGILEYSNMRIPKGEDGIPALKIIYYIEFFSKYREWDSITISKDSTGSGLQHWADVLSVKDEYKKYFNLCGVKYYDIYSVIIYFWKKNYKVSQEIGYFYTRSHLKKFLMTISYNARFSTVWEYFIKSVDSSIIKYEESLKKDLRNLYLYAKDGLFKQFMKESIEEWERDMVLNAYSYKQPDGSIIELIYCDDMGNGLNESVDGRFLSSELKLEYIKRRASASKQNEVSNKVKGKKMVYEYFSYVITRYKISSMPKVNYNEVIFEGAHHPYYVFNSSKTNISLKANYIHSRDALLVREVIRSFLLEKEGVVTVHDQFIVSLDKKEHLNKVLNENMKSSCMYIVV